MIINKKTLSIENKLISEYLCEESDSLFFDIETTGLFWKNSHLYLIGAVYQEDGVWIAQQWFLDRPSEELQLLLEFATLVNDKKRVIHFNGDGFDIPYLQNKYRFYQLENPFLNVDSLDLYRRTKPFQKLLNLPSVKQKDVEKFLKVNRTDIYTGGELINVYSDYLASDDKGLLDILLQHNLDDICGLVDILPILGYSLLTKESYEIVAVNFTENKLNIDFRLNKSIPQPIRKTESQSSLYISGKQGCLSVQAKSGVMKHFFADYKNYYYLPLEDQAIHKSVGAYVDTTHRKKATAHNCYLKLAGIFLPQLTECFQPVFRETYGGQPYFQYAESLLSKTQDLKPYLYDYLTFCIQN